MRCVVPCDGGSDGSGAHWTWVGQAAPCVGATVWLTRAGVKSVSPAVNSLLSLHNYLCLVN